MKELLLGAGTNQTRRVVLEGGSETWTNLTTLDINPAAKPNIVWDLNKLPYPMKTNEFDEIHAYEVLEHVGHQGDWKFFFKQFDEFARILKHKGLLCITTPKLTSAWLWGDPGHTRYLGPESYVFLDREAYQKQLGVTTMTDYRPYFKSHWKCLSLSNDLTESTVVVLVNLKE